MTEENIKDNGKMESNTEMGNSITQKS